MSRKYRRNRKKSAHLQEIYASQNFLTSRRLLERIVRISTITKNDLVIEIGTGKGHLTEVLCRRAKYVYSMEIDKKLYERHKSPASASQSGRCRECHQSGSWSAACSHP